MSEKWNMGFSWNKNIVFLCIKDYIFWSYHLLVEVTFKAEFQDNIIPKSWVFFEN